MMMLSALLTVQAAAILPTPQDDRLAHALLVAEDGRAGTEADLRLLLGTIDHEDAGAAGVAVRALGRLERPEVLPALAQALADPRPVIRAEAANAMAQAVSGGEGIAALPLLEARLATERDPVARRAVFEALGRLRLPDTAAARIIGVLTAAALSPGSSRSAALRGLVDAVRAQSPRYQLPDEAALGLRKLVQTSRAATERTLALTVLVGTSSGDSITIAHALADEEMEVRRLAAGGLRTASVLPGREALIARALVDRAFQVRYEAARAYGTRMQQQRGCDPLVSLLTDTSPHLVLLAIDLLGTGCGAAPARPEVLAPIADEPLTPEAWHRPAHALVSLARVAPSLAAARLPRFQASDVVWVRMYAAQAAGRLADRGAVRMLLDDPTDNVREAALRTLLGLEGHGADSVALAQLTREDFQLVLTAANALKGSPAGQAMVPQLLDALQRVTATRRDTSRDPRRALLDRIEEFGGPDQADALRPYLTDYDAGVAERAAALITRWSGTAVQASAEPLPPLRLPTPAERRSMQRATIVLADGGRMVVRLWPQSAPTNVARFVRMARAGQFNGLTFHRVVPNFVLQGGSPGANEYVGAARFTRDEVGGSHLRGTVGISTRGRDTGDGQLFLNLVDNLRLDHDYTVIGTVVAGLDAMDRVLEGAVIARVDVP